MGTSNSDGSGNRYNLKRRRLLKFFGGLAGGAALSGIPFAREARAMMRKLRTPFQAVTAANGLKSSSTGCPFQPRCPQTERSSAHRCSTSRCGNSRSSCTATYRRRLYGATTVCIRRRPLKFAADTRSPSAGKTIFPRPIFAHRSDDSWRGAAHSTSAHCGPSAWHKSDARQRWIPRGVVHQ
jgi:hypothetical protein